MIPQSAPWMLRSRAIGVEVGFRGGLRELHRAHVAVARPFASWASSAARRAVAPSSSWRISSAPGSVRMAAEKRSCLQVNIGHVEMSVVHAWVDADGLAVR